MPKRPERIDRVDVLGVGVSAINMEMAVAEISRWIDEGERHYVCVTGVHGVMESQDDSALKDIHNRSGLTTPDGMPMVWAGHKVGADHMSRVYGPDMMLKVHETGIDQGWKHFYYGGAEDIPGVLKDRMTEMFPGLKVVGTYSPPFRELSADESEDVVKMINESGAHLVWVGLSTPKQERWMSAHRDKLDAAALLGVGAAFDMHAGRLPQAPGWMQERGLEWLYRLVKEPKRLWRRYFKNNPRFVYRIMRNPPTLRAHSPQRAD